MIERDPYYIKKEKEESKICPNCGDKLKLKKIKKQPSQYRRGLRSYICEKCNYAEYDSNEREQAITDGLFDDEL